MSIHSEDDSLSSIASDLSPLAAGDSKETLLKFIMRVNKKHEKVSVGVQTKNDDCLVAKNYQQLHAVNERITRDVERCDSVSSGVTSRDMLQIHLGDVSLLTHSSENITTKISCCRVLLLDREIENKCREFPYSRWTGRQEDGPEILVRLDLEESPAQARSSATINTCDGEEVNGRCRSNTAVNSSSVRSHSIDSDLFDNPHSVESDMWESVTSSELKCEVVVKGLVSSLCESTLEELSLFFEPDPSLIFTPVTLSCSANNCGMEIRSDTRPQVIDISGVTVKIRENNSIEVGDTNYEELLNLRRENALLRQKLELAGLDSGIS